MIPYMDFTEKYNPGRLFELYLSLVPAGGTLEGREGGFLFSKYRAQSLSFNLHNSEEDELFQPNQKGRKSLGCKYSSYWLQLGRIL